MDGLLFSLGNLVSWSRVMTRHVHNRGRDWTKNKNRIRSFCNKCFFFSCSTECKRGKTENSETNWSHLWTLLTVREQRRNHSMPPAEASMKQVHAQPSRQLQNGMQARAQCLVLFHWAAHSSAPLYCMPVFVHATAVGGGWGAGLGLHELYSWPMGVCVCVWYTGIFFFYSFLWTTRDKLYRATINFQHFSNEGHNNCYTSIYIIVLLSLSGSKLCTLGGHIICINNNTGVTGFHLKKSKTIWGHSHSTLRVLIFNIKVIFTAGKYLRLKINN